MLQTSTLAPSNPSYQISSSSITIDATVKIEMCKKQLFMQLI